MTPPPPSPGLKMCCADVKLCLELWTPLPQSFCHHPHPLIHWLFSPFLLPQRSFHLSASPTPSLLHVPASVTVSVCPAAICPLRPGQEAGGLAHCLGRTCVYRTFMHPRATLHKQVRAGGGLAPRPGCPVHAQGCRLHPCIHTGPQTHCRVPAAQRL